MKTGGREFVVAWGTAAAYALLPSQVVGGGSKMHGLIGKMMAIAKGRSLIAGFGESFTTEPFGGHGLAKK